MERLARSQVVKGLFLLVLVFFIPFVSSSLRTSYLYVLLNILIVAVGAEAGLLEAIIVRPQEEKKSLLPAAREDASGSSAATFDTAAQKASMAAGQKAQALRRCSSRPSIFFIGGFEGAESSGQAARREEEEISKQELFTKAEAFIGNFYNCNGMISMSEGGDDRPCLLGIGVFLRDARLVGTSTLS